MYRIEVDPHTHTVTSLHAYSTAEECARHGAEAGLKGIVITDHCSQVMAQRLNSVEAIENQKSLPPVMHGVRVWKGVETDIADNEGRLAFWDVPDPFRPGKTGAECLRPSREVVIASVHGPFDRAAATVEENTRMYLRVLENPYVDILGHTGRSGRPYQLEPVLKAAKRLGKMIEINSASLKNYGERSGPACLAIAKACKELGVLVTVSSDAHTAYQVGDFSHACAMLDSIGFPQELIANLTVERFQQVLQQRRAALA